MLYEMKYTHIHVYVCVCVRIYTAVCVCISFCRADLLRKRGVVSEIQLKDNWCRQGVG